MVEPSTKEADMKRLKLLMMTIQLFTVVTGFITALTALAQVLKP